MGSLATNRIEAFSFVGWRSEAPGQGMFNVYMTLTNEGGEAADVENYTWGIVPWKENGQEVAVSAAGPVIPEYDGVLEPGETGTVSYHVRVDDPSVIDAYEIHLSCADSGADGQYCPE